MFFTDHETFFFIFKKLQIFSVITNNYNTWMTVKNIWFL